MRSFILACVAVVVLAAINAAVLIQFQESAKAAFTSQSARL
jgi:hypothetical protein